MKAEQDEAVAKEIVRTFEPGTAGAAIGEFFRK
jgi:hypothetical protein